jgi:arginyl-tRNA--protein-N-Asp/Glu arginylyltransferase
MNGDMTHEGRTRLLAQAIARESPAPGEPFPCPYLPGRMARQVTLLPTPLVAGVYHSLMDLNFRRLGLVFYRPDCEGCGECRMVRVPVSAFRPSRGQRRCWTRNADLTVEVGRPVPTEAKRRLYKRYLDHRHDGQMDGSPSEFHGFLYTSSVRTVEIVYLWQGRLLGVGLADLEPEAMSAVYCYFDPDAESRSLGVFNVLRMVEECRQRGLPYLYLGYYVRGCGRMSYKAGYRPCEILDHTGRWVQETSENRTGSGR